MKKRYVIADVFTDTPFVGNPVAVVLDAEGMSTGQMQQIAAEFGYSETTFVLPPEDRANTAHVRIFTPTREIPFAGHPNVGTAFVLASYATAKDETLPEVLLFEEAAGLVPVRLLKNNGTISGAELRVPELLSCRAEVSAGQVAACLSLEAECISTAVHQPLVASVGLPFLIVELASRDALRRCVPNLQGFRAGRCGVHLCLYPGYNAGGELRFAGEDVHATDDRRSGDRQRDGCGDGAAGFSSR